MGTPHQPLPVKIIVGFIYRDDSTLKKAKCCLRRSLGEPDFESPQFPFNKTSYYEKEMGSGLRRVFISFPRLLGAEKLLLIKIATNNLEKRLADASGRRTINIDPGYVTLSKLVLATTKSFVHRLYVGRGIFEEITLYFKDGSFRAGHWTYPDFRTDTHISVFNEIRRIYDEQITKKYGPSQLYRCV